MKKLGITIMILIINIDVLGNSNDSIRVISFPKDIHFYTKLGPSYSQVEINDPNISDNMLFKPNPQSLLGFGFSYSWISLGISFTLPSTEEEEKKYGKTQKFDFEAHYTLRRIMIDLTLKSYKGFYLSNPRDYLNSWSRKEPYPQAPNLQTGSIAASFAYIFKPERYSPNAAYTFSKAMRRSGGSWMIGGFISINAVASDTSIVPSVIKQYVDSKLDLNGVVFSNIGVSFGYSHLFTIYRKNFIAFTLYPGISLQGVTQYSSLDGSKKEFSTLAMRNIVRVSIGRNGDKFYWGLNSYVESSTVKRNDSQIFLNSGHVELFLGYRLNTSNWRFMKGVDRLLHPRFLRFATGEPPQRD
ncbi:MAG TPA: hypothetical protein DIW31_07570 [Bacteroidales bacterium]|nr:hypothetical protein [Bacteroidales bacterium]